MLSFIDKKRMRRFFGKSQFDLPIPNLIKIQKNSYEKFLQYYVNPDERQKIGLEDVFSSCFPIFDQETKNISLEYVRYYLDHPKHDMYESIQRGCNYSTALRAVFRLVICDQDEKTGKKSVKCIKEQEVCLGELPLMTDRGTFVINGSERVVVSQVHRSPGVFYSHDKGRSTSTGKFLYNARIIPYRGSWLDLEFDARDVLHCRIDRRRKLNAFDLLLAFGLTKDDVLREFYKFIKITKNSKGEWQTEFISERFKGIKVNHDVINVETGELIIPAGRKVTARLVEKLKQFEGIYYKVDIASVIGAYSAKEIAYKDGEIIVASGEEVTEAVVEKILESKVEAIELLDINYLNISPAMLNTINVSKHDTKDGALLDIFRVIRPGEPVTIDIAEYVLHQTFSNPARYDLSAIGRMKMNKRHNLNIPETDTTLTLDDILMVMKTLINLKDGIGMIDDTDNLFNRRVKVVGELVENQFRLGLVRMERSILERMNNIDLESAMPNDLVNSKALMSVLKEFFSTSQLSQFMDQTNPLAEVTHKRRLSALGPGGLQKERAGVDVRDVHITHYGRMCPIETPEGQSIGLINSLATYAQINKYGFIESPYYKVTDGIVDKSQVYYLSAIEEERSVMAQATLTLDENGKILDQVVTCRNKGEIGIVSPKEVQYIDVSSKQMVSVAASLIPFLGHNDAYRAVMGSNMQRQAVPLINREAPLVGTGVESVVANYSGTLLQAKNAGIVHQVDSNRIVIRCDNGGVDIYTLIKYQSSNHGTCIDQRPIVSIGDVVAAGDIIADGASTKLGELALGQNVLIAFMPWNGYNFEDSIVISQAMVERNDFSSVHIRKLECIARDTRLGPEEIKRDTPASEDSMRSLDEAGIVHIGAQVCPGDVLVGKVTPKSETSLTPEEKLLRAIFGEKAADVKDSSLRVPPGVYGTVIGVQIYTRRGVEKDERAIVLERQEVARLARDRDDKMRIINDYAMESVKDMLHGQQVKSGPSLKAQSIIDEEYFSKKSLNDYFKVVLLDEVLNEKLAKIATLYNQKVKEIEAYFNEKVSKVQGGIDMPQGVLKIVKIFIASKLRLQPGDKMAGRHGNKGVVSKVVPVEDMPHLEDGTPVDMILNSLGIISRMNIGQVLETHLGWASALMGKQLDEMLSKIYANELGIEDLRNKLLSIYDSKNDEVYRKEIASMNDKDLKELADNMKDGIPFATPVFDGAKDSDVGELLMKYGAESTGQVPLIDGRTGEYFDRKVTVGKMYMLKLDHLVDDKMHARSTGPYSLVTQQPLGGKSHQGGQRFGEMECWALQGYGAAYTLREMLTVKSDDVSGRLKMYNDIVEGNTTFDVKTPESFHVMVKELNALCLDIELQHNDIEIKEEDNSEILRRQS